MRAAAPVTCGVAIEVPLYETYLSPGKVLRMLTPGAPRSTVLAPKLEKEARRSWSSVAATEMMLGLSYEAGYSGVTSLSSPIPSEPPLPAAATNRYPLLSASVIAFWRA
jgi:hypothetical protein